jgi:hypothetical protein
MATQPHLRRKADILAVLRRAGYSEDIVTALETELPDPVDIDRDGEVLFRYGITLDAVIDRMGGSP